MGPGVGASMLIGLLHMIYLYATDRSKVSAVGLVHPDAES